MARGSELGWNLLSPTALLYHTFHIVPPAVAAWGALDHVAANLARAARNTGSRCPSLGDLGRTAGVRLRGAALLARRGRQASCLGLDGGFHGRGCVGPDRGRIRRGRRRLGRGRLGRCRHDGGQGGRRRHLVQLLLLLGRERPGHVGRNHALCCGHAALLNAVKQVKQQRSSPPLFGRAVCQRKGKNRGRGAGAI